jgi:hypothetical protein
MPIHLAAYRSGSILGKLDKIHIYLTRLYPVCAGGVVCFGWPEILRTVINPKQSAQTRRQPKKTKRHKDKEKETTK